MAETPKFEALTVTTGGEEEIHIIEQRDLFFKSIIESFGIERLDTFSESASQYLAINDFDQYGDTVRRSDDVLHSLTLFGHLVGLVLDRRDDLNYHEITFHIVEPSQRLLKAIEEARDFRQSE